MKQFINRYKVLFISIAGAALLIVFMGSCRSSQQKYGCGGGVNKRMTWDRMERHINRP